MNLTEEVPRLGREGTYDPLVSVGPYIGEMRQLEEAPVTTDWQSTRTATIILKAQNRMNPTPILA
jgi:hypothetical protein